MKTKKNWQYKRYFSHFLVIFTFFLLPTPLPYLEKGLVNLDFEKWVITLAGIPLPKELFYLFFILILLTLATALVVSTIWGKVFCGWICPQNIYFEFLEKIHNKIKKRSPFYRKSILLQRSLDFFLTFCFAALTSWNINRYFTAVHPFVKAYLTLVPFGIFMLLVHVYKHRFCQNICPLAMFQKSLQRPDSLHVQYDKQREDKPCGVCYACEKACYVNIDIKKDPFHMDCTLCGACIDACDRVYKPKKQAPLLSYSLSLSSSLSSIASNKAKLLTLSVFVLVLFAYAAAFVMRPQLHIQLQAHSQLIKDEKSRNFEVFIANLSPKLQKLNLELSPKSFAIKGEKVIVLESLQRGIIPLKVHYSGTENLSVSEITLKALKNKKIVYEQNFYYHHH